MHYTEFKNKIEHYRIIDSPEKTIVEYDYRMPDGDLFHCEASSLAEARRKKDDWMIKQHSHDIIEQKIILRDSFLSENLMVREVEKIKNSCTILICFTIYEKDEIINKCCNRWDLIFDSLVEAYGLDARLYDYLTMEKSPEGDFIIIGEELHDSH